MNSVAYQENNHDAYNGASIKGKNARKGASPRMHNWKPVKIGELCNSIVPGRNKPKVFDGDIPWVNTPDLISRYVPNTNHEMHVSRAELHRCGGKTVPAGSVIMTCVGNLGLVAIASREVVINQQLHAFVCPDNIHNLFIAYALESQKGYMYKVASTTTIPYLNRDNCESIPIPYPPHAMQEKIVNILQTWDKAIEKTETLIAAKEKQFAWLVVSAFVEIRNRSKNNTFPLKKYLQETSQLHGTDLAIVASVGKAGIRDRSTVYSKELSKDHRKNKLVHKNEIVFGLASDRIVYGVNLSKQYTYSVSPAYKVFRVKNCNGGFLGYLLDINNSRLSSKYMITSARQGKAIDFDGLLGERFVFPSLSEQDKITATLDTAKKEINLLQKKAELYRTQKRGLMQKLLGEKGGVGA